MGESTTQNQSDNKPQKPDPDKRRRNDMGMGMQIVAQVIVGILAGLWLDRHFETRNSIYTIILATVMIVVALYQFIRQSFKN